MYGPDRDDDSDDSESHPASSSRKLSAAASAAAAASDALRYSVTLDAARPARRKVTARSHRVSYEAQNYGSEGTLRGPFRYLVGVHDKATGVVQLMEVDTGGVLGLQLTSVSGQAGAAAAGGLAGVDDRGRRDLLISSFGSRKKQRMDASAKTNIVRVANIKAAGSVATGLTDSAARSHAAGAVEGAAATTPLDLGATSAAKVEASLMAARRATLPPFDLEATDPALAYPLDGVLPPDVRTAFYDTVQELVGHVGGEEPPHTGWLRSLSKGSDYVVDRLLEVVRTGSDASGGEVPAASSSGGGERGRGAAGASRASTPDRLAATLLMGAMVALFRAGMKLAYRMPKVDVGAEGAGVSSSTADVEGAVEGGGAEDGGDDAPAPAPREPLIAALKGVPSPVVAHLLATFTEARLGEHGAGVDGVLYVRTPELTDRLASALCVLSLHVDGCSGGLCDAALLARDLRLTHAELGRFYRELGATTAAGAGRRGAAGAAAAGGEEGEGAVVEGAAAVGLIVTLRAPIVFPKMKLGRGRGK